MPRNDEPSLVLAIDPRQTNKLNLQNPNYLDRAALAGYPAANGPEIPVKYVRPRTIRAHPLKALFLCYWLVSSTVFSFVMTARHHPAWAWFGVLIACAILIYWFFWKLRIMSMCMKITTKRVIYQTGFWLFRRDTIDIIHADISEVQIRQSLLNRLFRIGEVAIISNSRHEHSFSLPDLVEPEKVRQIIDLYRFSGEIQEKREPKTKKNRAERLVCYKS